MISFTQIAQEVKLPHSLNPSKQVATRFVKARRLITETPWADRRKPNSAVLIMSRRSHTHLSTT